MLSSRSSFYLAISSILFLAFASPSLAQITATVEGAVTDPAGAALPGATVTAESPALLRGSVSSGLSRAFC